MATDARPLSWGGLWETEGGVEREEVEPLLLRPPHDALSWGGRGGGRERGREGEVRDDRKRENARERTRERERVRERENESTRVGERDREEGREKEREKRGTEAQCHFCHVLLN